MLKRGWRFINLMIIMELLILSDFILMELVLRLLVLIPKLRFLSICLVFSVDL